MGEKLLFLFVATLIMFSSFAQSKDQSAPQSNPGLELSFGVDGGVPIGNFAVGWNIGVGGTAKFAYNVDKTFAVTLESGYMTFLGKTIIEEDYKAPAINFIPIKAGFRYTFNDRIFYLEPQLGVSDASTSGASSVDFTYAINAGYRIVPGVDVSARYEAVSKTGTVSFIGLRFAYGFALGKK